MFRRSYQPQGAYTTVVNAVKFIAVRFNKYWCKISEDYNCAETCSSKLIVKIRHQGIKGWYWPQGLLSMPIDNRHKPWATPSDMTPVSSASKSDFLTSSPVIPGQCNFSCSREERMMASSRRLKPETFG